MSFKCAVVLSQLPIAVSECAEAMFADMCDYYVPILSEKLCYSREYLNGCLYCNICNVELWPIYTNMLYFFSNNSFFFPCKKLYLVFTD